MGGNTRGVYPIFYLQPCRKPAQYSADAIPSGQNGFWAEVTVPYVDLILDNLLQFQVGWRDHVAYNRIPVFIIPSDVGRSNSNGDGVQFNYHINERYANPGDLFWAEGAAFPSLDG